MKTLEFEVPDQLAKEIEGLVEAGWFASQAELARLALAEFVQRHRFELEEKFQRDDIRWALGARDSRR
jgi:Arc/MetJ-type ribon-helix-helix transcriptional regulator